MKTMARSFHQEAGFSFTELLAVMCGIVIIAGIGLPVVTTVTDSYSLVLAAQQITTQMQAARMKAVTNNETIQVRFFPDSNFYQIETSDGARLSGPHVFAPGIFYNSGDAGPAVTFGGFFVAFLPSGNLPGAGSGSAGRVKIINRSQTRIDIVVNANGMVRTTGAYRSSLPLF